MFLLVGGSGFLGTYLIKNILENTDEKIIATYTTQRPNSTCDRLIWHKYNVLESPDLLLKSISDEEPLDVIYLAAIHHPDRVEKEFATAWETNIVALSSFVNEVKNVKSFFYTSTDSVYGEGSLNSKFEEESSASPVNLYGRQKALAEQIVITYGYNVVRFPFILGPSLVETKKHFFDSIVSDLKAGRPVYLFEDSYRSTLSFNQAAKYLIELICLSHKEKIPDIVNIAGDEPLTKYEVGLKIAQTLGLDSSLVVPIKQTENNNIFISKRPLITLLNNEKIKRLLNLSEIKYRV